MNWNAVDRLSGLLVSMALFGAMICVCFVSVVVTLEVTSRKPAVVTIEDLELDADVVTVEPFEMTPDDVPNVQIDIDGNLAADGPVTVDVDGVAVPISEMGWHNYGSSSAADLDGDLKFSYTAVTFPPGVTIYFDGRVEYPDEYEPDEVVQGFWEMVADPVPRVKALGASGAICEVYGHNWEESVGRIMDLTIDPINGRMAGYTKRRTCVMCFTSQREVSATWKDAE